MATGFRSQQTFLLEVEYANMIAKSISNIMSFWSTLYVEYWQNYSKFWLIFGPDDIINDVIDSNLYKHNHTPMICKCTQVNDDTFVRFSVITKNVLILFIKE